MEVAHGSVLMMCDILYVIHFRKAWIALGNRSKEEAQADVVRLLECVCPTLKEAVLMCLKEPVQRRTENT